MLDGFSPWDLFRGHTKGLSDYRSPTEKAKLDRRTRAVLVVVPVLVGALIWIFHGKIASPGALLAGVSLLAGGFLTAFTHLSTLRIRLTERREAWERSSDSTGTAWMRRQHIYSRLPICPG